MTLKKLITKSKKSKKYSWIVRYVKNRPRLVTFIKAKTIFLDNVYNDITLSQRLYYFVFKKQTIDTCLFCDKFPKWNDSISKGYFKTCGDSVCKIKLMEETNLNRYGNKSVMQVDSIKKKQIQAVKDNNNGVHILAVKETRIDRDKKINKRFLERLPGKLISRTVDLLTVKMDACGHTIDVHKQVFYNRAALGMDLCTTCYSGKDFTSFNEKELGNIIESYGHKIIRRKRFGKHEADIYIPSIRVAIEYNGLYWHSELFKDNKYHQTKYLKLKELGINLIQVWEDDWINKKEMVLSRIKSKINNTNKRYYGRKCEIRILNSKDYYKFLRDNHTQSSCPSKHKIGLYSNDLLVAVMGFGKTRKFMGGNGIDNELLRFANLLNCSVVGGASKLFKYYIKNLWDGEKIISYHDCSWGSNTFYEKLGMDFDSMTVPNYWYILNRTKVHRFTFNKQKLVEQGADPNKTAKEILKEKKIYRLFGVGQLKYTYIKK